MPSGNPGSGLTAATRADPRRQVWLLVAVAGLFTLAELTITPLRMPLGWDEVTYIAQTSAHVSPIIMPPAHSRGPGLLAAPVTAITTSVVVLRVWMAVLSGAGLLGALLSWRGLRPARILALAGVMLGSIGVMLLSGPQVTPNIWEALGALAVTGLALQVATGRVTAKGAVPLIGAIVFALVVVRYQDALLILVPVVAGLAIMPAWRNRRVFLAIGAGAAAGLAEWCGEAYLFYGNPVQRLKWAGQDPKPGLYFSLPNQLRTIDGPGYCSLAHNSCPSWRYPGLTLWWLAFVALVVIGFLASRGLSRRTSALAIAVALCVLLGYGLLVPYASPRYLLPVLAMLAIPAADGIGWLVASSRWRVAAVAAVAAFLVIGAISQNYVLRSELQGARLSSSLYVLQADQLRRLGVRPPCSIAGSATPVDYYLGCSIWRPGDIEPAVFVPPARPRRLTGWRRIWLAGQAHVAAYIRDARAR